MRQNELAHYGILGMRWGVRRFQPYSVRGRKSGKRGKEIGEARKLARGDRRGDSSKSKSYLETRKEYREQMREEDRARKEAEYWTRRQNYLDNVTARDLYKNRKYFSEEEINSTMRRLKWENELRRMGEDEIARAAKQGESMVKKIFNTAETVNKYANIGINTYNTFAKLDNFARGKEHKIIGGGEKKKEDKK